MRTSAQSTATRGRHRWGRPGLIHVSAFVDVPARRSFIAWLGLGREAPSEPQIVGAHRPRRALLHHA